MLKKLIYWWSPVSSAVPKTFNKEDMATVLEALYSDLAYKAYKQPPKWVRASDANLTHAHVYWCEIP